MSDRYGRYMRLRFDRPHPKVLRIALAEIWRDVDADPDVNAVIVTGAGKVFSAGGDCKPAFPSDSPV